MFPRPMVGPGSTNYTTPFLLRFPVPRDPFRPVSIRPAKDRVSFNIRQARLQSPPKARDPPALPCGFVRGVRFELFFFFPRLILPLNGPPGADDSRKVPNPSPRSEGPVTEPPSARRPAKSSPEKDRTTYKTCLEHLGPGDPGGLY